MTTTHMSLFDQTTQLSHEWVRDVAEAGSMQTEDQGFAALRAVLHTLRDRLTIEEAAHLSAQLPLLLRGVFFEGWRPSEQPTKERKSEEFLAHVAVELGRHEIDPESATRATFRTLSDRISAGETGDVRHMLPAEVRELWPETA